MAVARHKGCGRHRLSNPSIIDELAASLQSGTEKCVGSAAYQQVLALGKLQYRLAVFSGNREGLLHIDVLTGF